MKTATIDRTEKTFAHYNSSIPVKKEINHGITNVKNESESYSVQTNSRGLTKSMFRRRFDDIRDYLKARGFTNFEREAVLKMLQLYAYYAKVYPKAETIAQECNISRRTVWYAIKKLEDQGLITRQNQYYQDEKTGDIRQTSNIYRLDKLVLALVQLLAEIGQDIAVGMLKMLRKFGNFWREIYSPDVIIRIDTGMVIQKTAIK